MSVSQTATDVLIEGPGLDRPADADTLLVIYAASLPSGFHRGFGGQKGLICLLSHAVDWRHAIVAWTAEAGLPVGVLGLRDTSGSFAQGLKPGLTSTFGPFGAWWRAGLLRRLETREPDPVLLIDGIAVATEMRGRGVGRILIAAAMQQSRQRGLSGLRLDVDARNHAALEFYAALGFTETRSRKLSPIWHAFGLSRVITLTLWS